MSDAPAELTGPDFKSGVPITELADGGMLLGHADGKPVLLARQGAEIFAIGATCTHYGGPLTEGLLVGDTVRCPWHHACFSLRTGKAIAPPALKPVGSWAVQQRDGKVYVAGEINAPAEVQSPFMMSGRDTGRAAPTTVVIIGAGAAGSTAAETLRREGFTGRITMIGLEPTLPYDRPNLSKDYLAGNAPEDWLPLRSADFYRLQRIDHVTARVAAIDVSDRRVMLEGGASREYDALLIATGADPVRLPVASVDPAPVHYLRTVADSRAIIAASKDAKTAVVLGASFIGLEVAASLTTRGVKVHVVAPEKKPLERVLGPALGDFVRSLHEQHGVTFHLERTAGRIDVGRVTLDNGEKIDADLVVAGVGVRPSHQLATDAGLTVDNGVVVNEFLETSAPGIFAAGDLARYPDARSGANVRVEHWVVAQRQGQTAARNMIGKRERFTATPFFWSAHYDVTINYVGHAEKWDEIVVAGSIEKRDCAVSFRAGGKTLAVATIGRDKASLEAELAMERNDERTLAALAGR